MKSIRRQLTRELLIVSLLLLTFSWAALFFAARAALIDQFDRTLRAQALAVGALLERKGNQLYLESPDRLPDQFGARKPRAYFEVLTADGTLVASSASLKNGRLPRQEVRGDDRKYWNLLLPNEHPGRAVALTFDPRDADSSRAPDPSSQRAIIVLAGDREDLDETLGWLLAIAGTGAALLLAATLWIVPRVLRRGLLPLDTLGSRVSKIDADSLAFRFLATDLPVELRPVATRLNELLARLENSFERERRVTADLAHELRTPIAELRTLSETALKWPATRDPATDSESLAATLHLESILGHMLALARSEDGRLPLTLATVDVAALMDDTWRPFIHRARDRGLRITPSLTPLTAHTDAALLRSIFNNLFENAVDYTPAGGEITFACARTANGGLTLTVANTTENLSSADVDRLFERFWRKEDARTTSTHVGLGLPLVRAFAHALRWQITATLDSQRTLTFTLTGPVSSAPEA